MYWKIFNRQRMFQWTACHNRHGCPNTSEWKQRLWCLPTTIIARSVGLLQERNFWRKYVIVMDRELNCDSALRVDFILMWLLPCVFIHFCCAVSYITQMRFHHQLMRFHKTAFIASVSLFRWCASLPVCLVAGRRQTSTWLVASWALRRATSAFCLGRETIHRSCSTIDRRAADQRTAWCTVQAVPAFRSALASVVSGCC